MIKERLKLRTIIISVAAGVVILGLKVLAYNITGSAALESDALESIVNVAAAIFALGAIVFSNRPADQGHPFGHGKIEYFSAAFEGGLITFASILIIHEAIDKFISPQPLTSLNLGLMINFSAGILNGALGYYLVLVGKKTDSKALQADGKHILSDFYTTIGILVSLIIMSFTNYLWIDSLVALLVGLLLAYTGVKLIKDSWNALMDKGDDKMLNDVVSIISGTKPYDIISIHNLKILKSGSYAYIDIHLVIPEFYEFRKAHDLTKYFTNSILKKGNIDGEFHIHMDPCDTTYCKNCDIKECEIRAHGFIQGPQLTVSNLTATRTEQLRSECTK